MVSITIEDIIAAQKNFEENELRAGIFDLSRNLIVNNFEVEGFLLILATWNFAVFRYAIKEFDLEQFKETIKILNVKFLEIDNENINTIEFIEHKNLILEIYKILSEIKGVEHTGASKIMHLKNPNLFVMWDGYIRGDKTNKLNKFRKGYYSDAKIVKYDKSGIGYYNFLVDMQELFKDLDFTNMEIPKPKLIDVYNYVNITLPIQEIEKQEKQIKKEKKILT